MRPSPLAITVAPNGARRTKADHRALPLTPDELGQTARACLDAGAAMLHMHVRDDHGRHVLDTDGYRAAIRAVRAAVGHRLVIQVTTEAVGRYGSAEQMALVRELRPEAVSLGLRELVPTTAAEPAAASFFAWLAEEPTLPQVILYSTEDIARYRDLSRRGIMGADTIPVLFVLGRYSSGQCAQPYDLLRFLTAWHGDLPPWTVCAFGPREHECAVAAAALGGDVRVGFENNLALRGGTTAPDNAALVQQVAEAAQALGRPLETADMMRARFARGRPHSGSNPPSH